MLIIIKPFSWRNYFSFFCTFLALFISFQHQARAAAAIVFVLMVRCGIYHSLSFEVYHSKMYSSQFPISFVERCCKPISRDGLSLCRKTVILFRVIALRPNVLIFKIFLQHSNSFKLCETLMIQMVILINFSTPRGPPHPRVREINYARKGDYIYEINLHYDWQVKKKISGYS